MRIARRDLDNTEVKAPYDALVVSREIGVGQFVNIGMNTAMLHNIETAEVVFPIAGFDTEYLPGVITGQPAQVITAVANQCPVQVMLRVIWALMKPREWQI